MKVEVGGITKFLQISCGKRHSLALDNMGTIYITGDNTYRQLGNSNVNIMMGFK
jgi:alpha-tubulin suppressor-like RCC1 family protein